MVELDVRRRPDGVPVVFHGGPPGRVLTGDASLPSLEDVLEHVAGRLAVDLELKEAGYEQVVVALALRYVAPERLVITSFLDDVVRLVGERARDIATGLVVGRSPLKQGPVATLSDVFPFRRLAASGAAFLAPSHLLDVTRMRARAAARGIPLLVWTVNDPGKLAAARSDRRLLGIVTDRLT